MSRPLLRLVLTGLLLVLLSPAAILVAASPAPVTTVPAVTHQDDDDNSGQGGGDDDDGGGSGGESDDNSGPGSVNSGPPAQPLPVEAEDDDVEAPELEEAESEEEFEEAEDEREDEDDDRGGNDPVVQVPIVNADVETGTDGYRAQQAVVQLVPGASLDAFLARHGAFLVAAIPDQRLYLIGLPGAPEDEVVLEPLLADAETAWAELNYAHQAPEGRPGRFFLSAEVVAPEQVAAEAPLPALALPAARACATGAGAVVAVLDTGVDATHPALTGRIAPGGWNVLLNSPDTRDADNNADDDGDGLIDEMSGHGTHVAGIVAQVAPEAGILPIKVLDSDGVGDAFYVAAGIYQAIGAGADVINLSLGSTRDTRVIRDAVAAASDAGIIVVAAAGNAARETPPEYPALDPNALGVAATDATDHKSDFSNYHPDLFISAPGTEVISTFPGGGFVAWSGTSMAAPWVAGAAALLSGALPPADIADRLAASADPLAPDPRYDGKLGAGRLDVGAAVCGSE